MNQLNSILLEGVITTEPEVAATSSTNSRRLVKFVLANDRYYRDRTGQVKQETMFIPVQCWGELGERCLKTIRKGMLVRCVGRLMMCRWQSKQGSQRSSIEVVCEHLEYRAPKASVPMENGMNNTIEILEDRNHEAEMLSETVVLYEF